MKIQSTHHHYQIDNPEAHKSINHDWTIYYKYKNVRLKKSKDNKASSAALSSMLLLAAVGKSNQPLVITTNPTVNSRDTVGLTLHRRTNSVLFVAISAAVQTPCNTKKQATSPVGISKVKVKNNTSWATPETINVAITAKNLA